MPQPLHMFYGNLAQLGKKSNSEIRSRSVTVKNWCNVLSMEGVTACGQHPECRVIFGRGGLILFGKIPVPTIELPKRRFPRFLDISLPEKLIGKSHRPQNKTFIKSSNVHVYHYFIHYILPACIFLYRLYLACSGRLHDQG